MRLNIHKNMTQLNFLNRASSERRDFAQFQPEQFPLLPGAQFGKQRPGALEDGPLVVVLVGLLVLAGHEPALGPGYGQRLDQLEPALHFGGGAQLFWGTQICLFCHVGVVIDLLLARGCDLLICLMPCKC